MLTHALPDPYDADGSGSYIILDHKTAGLGCVLGGVASWLPYVNQDGPVYVRMASRLYNPHEHDDNQFNWFFDQQLTAVPYRIYLAPHPVDAAWQSKHVPVSKISQLRRLASQKWVLKPQLIKDSEQYITNANTLGVHYRGTDKGLEVPLSDLHHVTDLIKEAIDTYRFTRVLLATDDDRVLPHFLRYTPWIDYFRCHLRSDSGAGVHYISGCYRQAYETMTEMIALGMCKHLIIGRSSIADVALILARNHNITWQYHN